MSRWSIRTTGRKREASYPGNDARRRLIRQGGNVVTEEWRDIPGFEGSYQVSDLGRVRSVDRVIEQTNRWGTTSRRRFAGQVLTAAINQHRGGYAYVNLHDGRGQHMCRVCGLVLSTFGGPRPPGNVARHRNGRPADDRAENLEWGTHKENAADMLAHGTRKFGEATSQARLTNEQMRQARVAPREELGSLSVLWGVTRGHLNSIRAGRRCAAI
jgi:hypothetical protein